MSITGLLITPDSDIAAVIELDDTRLLQSLYNALGCRYIETLELVHGIDAIFDEEGKLTGAQGNDQASVTALLLGHPFLPGDYLAGPVIFLGRHGSEYVSLTESQQEMCGAQR